MRKIRGFKLNLRNKEIQRRAKKAKLDLTSIALDSDTALTALIGEFSKSAKASVLYESFQPEDQNSLAPVPGLAYSLCLATLGQEVDSYFDLARQQKPERVPLLDIMAQTALDDATRFVLSLVEDEAKEEHCELSPMQLLTDNTALSAIVSRLEGHKIGVSASDTGLQPAHSAAFSLSWMAHSKSRSR
jgi:hypothetical protein